MKTSTSDEKHRIKWTGRMQLDDLNFTDDLGLLFHTHQQMQVKTNSVTAASVCISKPEHTHYKKKDPQIQHEEHQPNHS
ncbi:unnamed protein product [Schistosoma margrebowiei]|uniref:Uncharacterized protein n=1 Tax=Schistosoma margrebowiei TaxID=48269 RepID=A0A183NBP2_9TREM|nr:unnamed protein product [Schistosoma margrebowiei]